jgi:hypothetical protein
MEEKSKFQLWGKIGGKVGGRLRADKLSSLRKRQIARLGGLAKAEKMRKNHEEK